MMKFTPKRIALIAVGLLAVAVAGGLAIRGEYPTQQQASRSFTLPVDFTDVRKILVRKNGAKQIITMGGDSEFIDQQWSDVGAEIGSLEIFNPDWRLQLEGTLRVRTLDEYVGKQEIALAQDVTITADELDSHVKLAEGTPRLADYEMNTNFRRGEQGETEVELTLRQKIVTDAPWFAHGIADRRVRASVERTLANQERAIRRFIDENKDDIPLLPLR